ncbi:MAG: hypothetical protein JKY48_09470 [Flavobacteriales bacterium]|nr:hypothetical protein [Flavobacteriales bacterium]
MIDQRCSECSSVITGTKNIVISRPLANCNNNAVSKSSSKIYFAYQNENYAIKRENGQRTSWNLFLGTRKIWAKTIFFKEVNGNYVRRKPPVAIIAEVIGKYYTNGCTTPNSVSKILSKKRKSVCAKFNPAEAFGTIEDITHSDRIRTNHRAEMSNSFTYESLDWTLF